MSIEGKYKISPYPAGKDFAFSIVDDTDYCKLDDIVPVYELLNQLGFKTTKTVWVFDQKYNNSFRKDREKPVENQEWGVSLQDDRYLTYVKELQQKGFEIALHGVSAGNDYREDIIRGYERFKEIFGDYPRIDILHAQNIENLYCGKDKFDFWPLKLLEMITHKSDYQGHIPGSDYFWGDIARDRVDYIRLPFHEIKELNLLKINPTFPFHDPRRPYVKYWFTNSDGANYDKFMDLTCDKNMEQLEKENGTSIIYTHFANGFSYKNGLDYFVKEHFTERMINIINRNGWFASASQILDRFIDIRRLKLHADVNFLSVINPCKNNIEELTIVCNKRQDFRDCAGNIYHADQDGKIIIPLIDGESAILLWKLGAEAELIRPSDKIGPLEHIGIELFNYFGKIF